MRKFMYALLTLVVAFGIVRCGGGDDGPTDPDPDPDPNESPTVNITSPAEGATFDVEEEVTFEGSAEDPEDGSLTGASLVWTSDADGELGTGETVTTTLGEGEHDVTLEATDSDGASASASVGLTVEAAGGDDVVDMSIIDNAFVDPEGNQNANASITIDLGQTVRWTYDSDGSASHTVDSGEGTGGDSGSGLPEGGTAISSPTLFPGDVFEFTPDAAGTWTYYCEIHPGIMYEAKIIVNEG